MDCQAMHIAEQHLQFLTYHSRPRSQISESQSPYKQSTSISLYFLSFSPVCQTSPTFPHPTALKKRPSQYRLKYVVIKWMLSHRLENGNSGCWVVFVSSANVVCEVLYSKLELHDSPLGPSFIRCSIHVGKPMARLRTRSCGIAT